MDAELSEYTAHREDVLARIRQVLIERLHLRREPDELDPDTPLFGTGLGLDSVDAVEVLVSLDTDFGIKLPDDRTGRIAPRTINSLVDLVMTYGGRHDA